MLAPSARALARAGVATVWHVREHPGAEIIPWRRAGLRRLMRRGGPPVVFISHADRDVLVFPTTEPHVARPLIEAAARRVPTVASDLPGPRELLVHGVTGYLVPAGQARPLAHRLAELLCDAALRRRLGDAAAARAARLFAAPRVDAQLGGLYEGLLSGR